MAPGLAVSPVLTVTRAVAALTFLAWLLAAVPALALEAPDAATLERLRTEALTWRRFRVDTRNGEYFVRALDVDAEGVVIRMPQARPALIVTGPTDPGEKRRAAWAEVQRIAGQRPQALKGGVIGGAIGAVLGFGLYRWVDHNFDDVDFAIHFIPIGAALGAASGALIGGATGWRALYP